MSNAEEAKKKADEKHADKREHDAEQALDPSDIPSRKLPSDKRFGREIAFGIQQTLACWATDFIDPYIGKWYQNKYGNKEHEVTAAHTWGGELAGDSAALFVYLGAKRFMSKPIDAVTHCVKKVTAPLYEKVGKKSLEQWRQEKHLETSDPLYRKKLESYQEFQAENLVDSTIIAGSSTLINVGAQRALGNKQAMGLILTSKIIGAGLTMGTMLGLRTGLPDSTRTLDNELSERYFSKVVRKVQKVAGVDEKNGAPKEDDRDRHHDEKRAHHDGYDSERRERKHHHKHHEKREEREARESVNPADRADQRFAGSYADAVRKEDEPAAELAIR